MITILYLKKIMKRYRIKLLKEEVEALKKISVKVQWINCKGLYKINKPVHYQFPLSFLA
jgi:hypothetical protein